MPSAATVAEPVEIEQIELHEAHDFDIPCGYTNLRRNPSAGCGGANPAVWAVWYSDKNPCGCESPKFRYFCGPCWQLRNWSGFWQCHHCPRTWGQEEDNIIRVERIKP